MWLGIETSSVVSSVAVMNESQLLGEITIQAGLTHSEQLVPHIQSLLAMTRVEKSDLKGIVVASGPGSFTGLRIGMGTAKAMAYALHIPLYGVMTMDGLARNIPYTTDTICTVIDAQKKHVYAALYAYDGERLQVKEEPFVVEAASLVERLRNQHKRVVFVGDGIKRIAPLVADDELLIIGDPIYRIPKASSLLLSARPLIERGESANPMDMVPYYIRRSEAEVLWEEKHKEKKAKRKMPAPTAKAVEKQVPKRVVPVIEKEEGIPEDVLSIVMMAAIEAYEAEQVVENPFKDAKELNNGLVVRSIRRRR